MSGTYVSPHPPQGSQQHQQSPPLPLQPIYQNQPSQNTSNGRSRRSVVEFLGSIVGRARSTVSSSAPSPGPTPILTSPAVAPSPLSPMPPHAGATTPQTCAVIAVEPSEHDNVADILGSPQAALASHSISRQSTPLGANAYATPPLTNSPASLSLYRRRSSSGIPEMAAKELVGGKSVKIQPNITMFSTDGDKSLQTMQIDSKDPTTTTRPIPTVGISRGRPYPGLSHSHSASHIDAMTPIEYNALEEESQISTNPSTAALRLPFDVTSSKRKIDELMNNVSAKLPAVVPMSNVNCEDPFEASASLMGTPHDPRVIRRARLREAGFTEIAPPTLSIQQYSSFVQALAVYKRQLKATAEAASTFARVVEGITHVLPSSRHAFEREYDTSLRNNSKVSEAARCEEEKTAYRFPGHGPNVSSVNPPQSVINADMDYFIRQEPCAADISLETDVAHISEKQRQIRAIIVDHRMSAIKSDLHQFLASNTTISNVMDQWAQDLESYCEEPLTLGIQEMARVAEAKRATCEKRMEVIVNLIKTEDTSIRELMKHSKGRSTPAIESSISKRNHLAYEYERLSGLTNNVADIIAQEFAPFLYRSCRISLQHTADYIGLLQEGASKVGLYQYYHVNSMASRHTLALVDQLVAEQLELKSSYLTKKYALNATNNPQQSATSDGKLKGILKSIKVSTGNHKQIHSDGSIAEMQAPQSGSLFLTPSVAIASVGLDGEMTPITATPRSANKTLARIELPEDDEFEKTRAVEIQTTPVTADAHEERATMDKSMSGMRSSSLGPVDKKKISSRLKSREERHKLKVMQQSPQASSPPILEEQRGRPTAVKVLSPLDSKLPPPNIPLPTVTIDSPESSKLSNGPQPIEMMESLDSNVNSNNQTEKPTIDTVMRDGSRQAPTKLVRQNTTSMRKTVLLDNWAKNDLTKLNAKVARSPTPDSLNSEELSSVFRNDVPSVDSYNTTPSEAIMGPETIKSPVANSEFQPEIPNADDVVSDDALPNPDNDEPLMNLQRSFSSMDQPSRETLVIDSYETDQ